MITLNPRDTRPLYMQVKDSLRRMILSGALPENEHLPSVRELAASLAINPNTIQRAYRELEAEGYIRSIPGKGSFACGGDAREARREELLAVFDTTAEELMHLGLTAQELAGRIGRTGGTQE